MNNILKASITYKALAAVGNFFGRQWRGSVIISWFLTYDEQLPVPNGVISTAADGFHGAIARAYRALHLKRPLANSIFQMPFLWCALLLFLAPLIPTMAALAVAGVAYLSMILKFASNRELRLTRSPLTKLVLLYALVYLISIFTSVTPIGSAPHGLMHVAFIGVAIVTANAVDTRRKLEWAVRLFALSGTLVSLYGIAQYILGSTGATAWLDEEMFSGIGVRVYSTLANPNVLSEYLLLVIPFCAALVVTEKAHLSKLLFAGCTAIMLACMVLTFARGGWLGLIAAIAVMLIMLDRRFILLGITGLIAMYFVLPDVILNRFLSIGNLQDGSTSYRLSIWLGSLSMMKDYWFSGIGPGTAAFNLVYPFYSYNTIAAPHSHNLFLQVLCDSGITGIAVFLAVLWTYIRTLSASIGIGASPSAAAIKTSGFKRQTAEVSSDASVKTFKIAAIASLVGFMLQGMTDYSFYNYRVALVFWIVVGLGVAVSRRK
jgi:O-antigen ligase